MERVTGECPLGSKCETVIDDKIVVCPWYIKVSGDNPNTGERVDQWGCAISWAPLLMIENSKQQMKTGAAVESFRNEMVKQNNQLAAVMLHTAGGAKLIEGDTNAENERAVGEGAGIGQN
jgi:hypothetical protein